MILNPTLPGFNPDPSICRVGEDYYIATSTFEWYPGVQIHHSRDLVNWRLVARRQEDFAYEAETALDFEPETYQQAAGLTTYYNRTKFHAWLLTEQPGLGRALTILSCLGNWPDSGQEFPVGTPVPVPVPPGPVEMKVAVNHATQQFYWRQPATDWQSIGPVLNAAVISDEGGRGEHASFTGAFVGMIAFDITGQGKVARFGNFTYRPV